jgi:hypothetical protein
VAWKTKQSTRTHDTICQLGYEEARFLDLASKEEISLERIVYWTDSFSRLSSTQKYLVNGLKCVPGASLRILNTEFTNTVSHMSLK